jgi:lipoic acid synthetase
MDAHPDILNHNLEVVPRLSKEVQPQNHFEWSRDTLVNAKKLDPHVLTKSGLMVGMGEEMDEIKAAMRDLRAWDVDILTIGQYLQPSRHHWPIARYYRLDEFDELKRYGEEIGFKWVESGPLVRSSYHAAEQVRALSERYGRLSAARQS